MRTRLALAFVLVAAPASAAPPDKAACIAAFDRGQQARSDEKLRKARDELVVCSNEACPAVLRKDCASVLGEVQNLIPTVVLSAHDDRADLVDVRVTLDGAPVATRLDGKAMEIDPGEHVFHFEWRTKSVDEHVAIKEGEKSRPIRAAFEPDPVAAAPEKPAPSTPNEERSTVGWVVPSALAAVGVAGLAIAGISRLRFDSQVSDDRASGGCAPDCTEAHRDDLSKTLVTANVALVSGLVLLGGAVIGWIVLGPKAHASNAALAW